MYTRSQLLSEKSTVIEKPESGDSVLTDTLNSESKCESSWDLIYLNSTFIEINMENQLDFVTALKFIPEFTGGSETDLALFISKSYFQKYQIFRNLIL
jgi:hypothetical protein